MTVYGRPQVLNNIRSENDRVFDVCAKYLASRPDANRTWMLTHDVDEFVWFNKTQGIESLHDAVRKLVDNDNSTALRGYSLSIPRLRFGSSGHNEYSNDFVIDRFQQRYNHENCPPGSLKSWSRNKKRNFYGLSFCELRPGSWDNLKSMSLVSKLAQDCFLPYSKKTTSLLYVMDHTVIL